MVVPRLRSVTSISIWECPRCATRSISSSARQLQVGPEHPHHIDIPEPPQQTASYRPLAKGTLPVPRNIFPGRLKDYSSEEFIAKSTKLPLQTRTPKAGSREEWKLKMSEARRQNLQDGVRSLKSRQDHVREKSRVKGLAKQAAREQALHRPLRDDERLTMPSSNFDPKALARGQVDDPMREDRLLHKQENLERHELLKREKRLNDLHTLYMNARHFIVTPEQLDKHVDEVFGTADEPVLFGQDQASRGFSAWADGRPITVQEMLNREINEISNRAMNNEGPAKDRMMRLAEALTGGKMDAVAKTS